MDSGTSAADGTLKASLRRIGAIPTPVIFVVCLILGVALLWWQGALDRLWETMRDGSVSLMVAGFLLYLVGLAILCVRWHALIEMAHPGGSDLPKASEAFLTSIIISYAAPIGLAVPSRAALTRRSLNLDARATGSIALWEIGADVAVLGVGSLIWILVAQGATGAVADTLGDAALEFTLAGILLAMLAIVAGVVLLRKPALRAKVVRLAKEVLNAPRQQPRPAAIVLGISIVYWILQAITLAVFVEAMGVSTSVIFVLGLSTVPMLIGILSPIPGGAVVRESLMYVVARLSDLPGGEVVAGAVLYRMSLFLSIPILYVLVRIWIGVRRANSGNTTEAHS